MIAGKQPAKRNMPAARAAHDTRLQSAHTDWVDKQDIMELFHFSDRFLQKLRDSNEIIWSSIGGKLYYYLPSFVALLEKNKRGSGICWK